MPASRPLKPLPQYLASATQDAGFSARDIYQSFGYSSPGSLSACSVRGYFPQPDLYTTPVGKRKAHYLWHKQTVLAEWNRRHAAQGE